MADTTNKKKAEDYGSFDYADYQVSESETQLKNKLDSLQDPGDLNSTWKDTMNDVVNKIMNRDKFTYDVNGDALYQQYKDQYITQGKLAMQDTMGQAAAMTGGYGNSYAQNVGQQAYQGYLQQLNDKVPELYQLALDQYNREGEDMYNQYGLVSDMYDTEYKEHRDKKSDYITERDYLTNQLNTEREFNWNQYTDKRDFAYNQFSDNRNLEYQLDSDAVDNAKWQAEFDQTAYQIEENLKLEIRKIEEDERNGKISREVALREIELREQEAKDAIDEAQKELEYKYAALQASTTGSYTDLNGKTITAPAGTEGGGGNNGSGDSFERYTYADLTENGESKFYRDGKEYTFERGVNPYTGTKNPDAKNGTFNNGYQPNNVGKTKDENGKEVINKLSNSGRTDVVNGVTQTVWKDLNGNLWIWDGTQNKYLKYED